MGNLMNKSISELFDIVLSDKFTMKDRLAANRMISIRNTEVLYMFNNCFDNHSDSRKFFRNLDNGVSVTWYIYNDNIPDSIKKNIIRYGLSNSDVNELLKSNISFELKKLIVKENVSKYYGLKCLLMNNDISDEIKIMAIDTLVDAFNIFEIVTCSEIDMPTRRMIIDRKKILFIRSIYSKSTKDLLYELTFSNSPWEAVKLVQEYQPALLNNLSSKLDFRYLERAFSRCNKNEELLNMVLTANKDKIPLLLSKVHKDVILWLELDGLPIEYQHILIDNNIKFINSYIDGMDEKELLRNLNNYNNCVCYKDLIVNRRLNDLIVMLDNYTFSEYVNFIKYKYYNDELIYGTIDKKLPDDMVIDVMNEYKFSTDVIDFILKYKRDYFISIISGINWNEIINGNRNDDNFNIIFRLHKQIQFKVYTANNALINDILNKYDREELNRFLIIDMPLNDENFLYYIKLSIFKILGISGERLDYVKIILSRVSRGNPIELLKRLELFLGYVGIDLKLFFQYGSYILDDELWISSINDIMENNELNSFISVKNYLFDNYYDNRIGSATNIINFNDMVRNYTLYKELLLGLVNDNIKLSIIDKNNLTLLFNGSICCKPRNLIELNEIRKNEIMMYKNDILSDDISLEELRNILNKMIVYSKNELFDDIGDIASLRILVKDNEGNKRVELLTDEIITTMYVINTIVNITDKEKLKKLILEYIENVDNPVNRVINDLPNIKEKVRRLYEIDSQYNLTTLEEARDIPSIYNYEYMDLYGGEVFDFSDTNYVLYAHVKSRNEDIVDLINGKSYGKNNFISFSPISYRGQKYYYDFCECILAYDNILDGNFICSSLVNMGSNDYIENNSAVVKDFSRSQRGILESSSASKQNAETLLYREGLKPVGIILVDGKRPTKEELEYHRRYNLPFIITQKNGMAIDNPRRVFKHKKNEYYDDVLSKNLENTRKYIDINFVSSKEDDVYTGREVAIFTDTHAMYEPTIAILEDIKSRGIKEIYSLGDNTTMGANPREVLELMNEYDVKQIMGNSEYYLTLGSAPFSYLGEDRERNLNWICDKIGNNINDLKLYKPSTDILIGNRKIALCHFANDIRWDYNEHNTWIYQNNINNSDSANQFLFTNSSDYKMEIENNLSRYGISNPQMAGYLSAKNDPLFDGKMVTCYDDVFQGHVHFELEDNLGSTNIHTIRAAGMGEVNNTDRNKALYVILKERHDGNFDMERVFVPYNRNSLLSSIYSSDMPSKTKVLTYLK